MFPAIVEAAISVSDPVAEIPPPSVAVLPVTDTPSTDRAPSLWIAPPVPAAAFPMKSESSRPQRCAGAGPDGPAVPALRAGDRHAVQHAGSAHQLDRGSVDRRIARPEDREPLQHVSLLTVAVPSVKARCPSDDTSMKIPVSPPPSIVIAERRSMSPRPTPPLPVNVSA